ncbi:HD domain-containing phosphohydrolase [Cupriavidus alkaliphilus]|uniref:HD domain-containing phosphohydrolase n=1 Tax=Cupriavidus alkaliphilus TaxID=942866 RepID=UPI0008162DBD|nr:HD domain-containing phosphohydrolase [Cupriavidus alkaliphilus]SCB21524.1 HD domain-containing protein [Cupriavidus alkaliphilus]
MQNPVNVPLNDAVLALAFVGDLSMGQPTDHSLRTARLASSLAAEAGGSIPDRVAASQVALLRWSGCTANASGFEQLLGDDVAGRDAMLTLTLPAFDGQARAGILPLAQIHCEVSGDIASMLGLGAEVEAGLRNVFEAYDGNGMPGRIGHPHVPPVVYHVALASDLEILSRAHGIDTALAYIAGFANARYPAALVALVSQHAKAWLEALESAPLLAEIAALPGHGATEVALPLVGDVIDLKLPWLAGHSRQVAELAKVSAAMQGFDADLQNCLYRAGLIHGVGRAALPNRLWNNPGRLQASDWERVRLMPYWTFRAARHFRQLGAEAELASYAYERLDGSGYYRGLAGDALSGAQRTLAVSTAWVALRSRRPWRAAHSYDDAAVLLRSEAAQGRFDGQIVEATLAAARGDKVRALPSRSSVSLSERETEVLRQISLGESNKEVARTLAISPSTVRTHVENIFRKLECSTRAAATLKAFTLGLL